MVYRFDDDLRSVCEANLARFEALPAEGDDGRTRAAVALCVVPGPDGEACLLVTRRARGLRAHPGQMALPGGRLDPDESALAGALREMHEEVGLRCDEGDVIGRLDDYLTRAGHRVTPVVVWGPPTSELVLRAEEVASVHLVPLSGLDHSQAPRLLAIPDSEHPVIQMPVMGHWIHAPTAAFLYQFREVVLHGRPTRVAHFEQPFSAWGR
jgi:8-oxo-dGTP pyrophosphatase MutT (NUDIX family)